MNIPIHGSYWYITRGPPCIGLQLLGNGGNLHITMLAKTDTYNVAGQNLANPFINFIQYIVFGYSSIRLRWCRTFSIIVIRSFEPNSRIFTSKTHRKPSVSYSVLVTNDDKATRFEGPKLHQTVPVPQQTCTPL